MERSNCVAMLVQQFLDFEGLSGVTLDYSKEWEELAAMFKGGLEADTANGTGDEHTPENEDTK